jgi:hypothetical protein
MSNIYGLKSPLKLIPALDVQVEMLCTKPVKVEINHIYLPATNI